MEVYGNFSFWIFKPEVWILLGICLIILDIFVGLDFFVLPVGISALILSGIIYIQINNWFGEFVIFETWRGVLTGFGICSLISVAIIKFAFQNTGKSKDDINKY